MVIFLLTLLVIVITIAVGEGILISFFTKEDKQNGSRIVLEERIIFFKRFWRQFVVYVIATSIILLFVASFILNQNITLSIMNEWVSLILGMVALVIGVISLYLSFYNVDQANESQSSMLKEMKELVNSVNTIREQMNRFSENGLFVGTSKTYTNDSNTIKFNLDSDKHSEDDKR